MADQSNQTNAGKGRGRGGGGGRGGGRGLGTIHNTGPDGFFSQPTPAGSRTGSRMPNQTSNAASSSPARTRLIGQVPSSPGQSPRRPGSGQQQSPSQQIPPRTSINFERVYNRLANMIPEKKTALAGLNNFIKAMKMVDKTERNMMQSESIQIALSLASAKSILDKFEQHCPVEDGQEEDAYDQFAYNEHDDNDDDGGSGSYNGPAYFDLEDDASNEQVRNTIELDDDVKNESSEEEDVDVEVDAERGF